MRTADTILNIIQDRGKRMLPLDDVYRPLYNPDMYLRGYARIYKNAAKQGFGRSLTLTAHWCVCACIGRALKKWYGA